MTTNDSCSILRYVNNAKLPVIYFKICNLTMLGHATVYRIFRNVNEIHFVHYITFATAINVKCHRIEIIAE